MSARDELYRHVHEAFDALDNPGEERDMPTIITDALMAAGYRRFRLLEPWK